MSSRSKEDSYPIDLWPVRQGGRDSQLQRKLIVGAARAAEATLESGELVVRRGDLVGRLLFVEGRIAWIHCHGHRGYLADLIIERAGVSRADIKNAVEASKVTGVPLGEALVAAGKLRMETLYGLLLEHVRYQLSVMFESNEPVALLFLPVQRSYSGEYLFTIDEVLGEHRDELAGAVAIDPSTVVSLMSAKLFAVHGAIACGAVVTANRIRAEYQTHAIAGASEAERLAAQDHGARLASTVSLAVDVAAPFAPQETVHIAREHYIYERKLSTATVFVMARASDPLGVFIPAVRAATRDLIA